MIEKKKKKAIPFPVHDEGMARYAPLAPFLRSKNEGPKRLRACTEVRLEAKAVSP